MEYMHAMGFFLIMRVLEEETFVTRKITRVYLELMLRLISLFILETLMPKRLGARQNYVRCNG